MDADLEQRLAFFEEARMVDRDLCRFVRDELVRLASAGFEVNEESAGMLTSHLLTALQRVRAGEPVEVPEGADLIEQQLAGQRTAVELAEQLGERASVQHQVALPPHEVNFVALHIATVPQAGASTEQTAVDS